MKRIWIIALVSIVLGTVSCSKDDNKEIDTYSIIFDTDGGTPVPSSQQIEEGKTAIAPTTNPTKTGYVFMFWHLTGTSIPYNFNTPVSKDITLYAKWQAEATAEYWQVSWELSGGTWATGDDHATQVVKGGTLAEPTAPTKTGKVFDGWYKESELTNKINFPYNVSVVTANFTLYAKWGTEGGNPPSNNHKISNATEWNAAVAAVNAAGNDKTHTFTITQSFSLPGVGTKTIFTQELTGITVTIKGQGSSIPEISLSSVGYLIYLGSISQKIVLENIVLKGRENNTAAVLGVKRGEMVIGEGAIITGNTNTAGGAGGVDVGGKLIMVGGKIIENIAGTASQPKGQGGGVFVDYMAEFIMESGSINSNKVYGQGGGVYIGLFARFIMKGGDIFRNTAWMASSGARGGGVYNQGGDFYMSGGKITGYAWLHGNEPNTPEHYSGYLEYRDNCNTVVIGVTAMGIYGAALYSTSGNNYYGTYSGGSFTKTGEFGYNISIERNIEIADGVRLNRFDVNGKTYHTYRGGVDYWGNFFNDATENVFLGLNTIYGEWIALDVLVPKGNNKLVAGTYTFSTASESAMTPYTFVSVTDNCYAQDADGNKLKITGGVFNVSIYGTGDNAINTIAVDCTLENGGKVKGTYRGVMEWYDRSSDSSSNRVLRLLQAKQ